MRYSVPLLTLDQQLSRLARVKNIPVVEV